MNHKRLLNALAKVGAAVSNQPHGKIVRYRATKGDNVLVWYAQPMWNNPEELEAVSVHAPSPHTDIMTDCFCDTFYSTIRSAAASLG